MIGTEEDLTGMTERLVLELERMPAKKPTAMLVLKVLGDEESCSRDVARAVSTDPVLVARVMRIANSAYYGMNGRVGSPQMAVSVLGFNTLRALTVAALAGIGPGTAPDDFWERAARTAAACSVLAIRFAVPEQNGFCAGMLADLGSALLHQADPERHTEVRGRAQDQLALSKLEREEFGITARKAAGRVLTAWELPAELVAAVETEPWELLEHSSGLTRLLAVSRLMTDRTLGLSVTEADVRRASGGLLTDLDLQLSSAEVEQVSLGLLEVLREE